MSIINDTLKSLEEKRRKESFKSSSDSANKKEEIPPMKKEIKHSRRMYVYSSFIIISVFSGIMWHVIASHHDKTHAEKRATSMTRLIEKKKHVPSPKHDLMQVFFGPKKEKSVLKLSEGEASEKASALDTTQLVLDISGSVEAHDSKQFKKLINHLSSRDNWRTELTDVVSQLEEMSRFVVAERVVKAFLDKSPSDSSLKIQLAHVYFKEGNIEKAVSYLKNTHLPVEENTDYYAFLAYLLVKEKRYQESIQLYQQLVSINSTKPIWWIGLGISYLSLGESHQALLAFERAKAHTSDHAPYRYYLSQKIYELSGNVA